MCLNKTDRVSKDSTVSVPCSAEVLSCCFLLARLPSSWATKLMSCCSCSFLFGKLRPMRSFGGKGWLTELMNEWINDKGDYRTAPATPSLLIIQKVSQKYPKKVSKRYPKSIPKVSQKCPKSIPKVSQKYPKSNQKIPQKYPKNPSYGRQQLSRPMRIVGPKQIWRGCVIYLYIYGSKGLGWIFCRIVSLFFNVGA